MKTVTEILTKARELLAKPGGWTQSMSAAIRSDDAEPLRIVPPSDPFANCFCVTGAMFRTQNAEYYSVDSHRGFRLFRVGAGDECDEESSRALGAATVLLAKHMRAEYFYEHDKAPEDGGVDPILSAPLSETRYGEYVAFYSNQRVNDALCPHYGQRIVLKAMDAAIAEARAA